MLCLLFTAPAPNHQTADWIQRSSQKLSNNLPTVDMHEGSRQQNASLWELQDKMTEVLQGSLHVLHTILGDSMERLERSLFQLERLNIARMRDVALGDADVFAAFLHAPK